MDIQTKNQPIVSVRLMTYNHAEFIKEAMDGIMKQRTNFPVEVVVGDDFSTDDTLKIIHSYNDTDNIKIKILNRKIGDNYWQKRQKLGRLYNFTNILDNCKGKYIALLDGDDYWTDPNKLQKQVDFLEENHDYSLVFHNRFVLDLNGNLTKGPLKIKAQSIPQNKMISTMAPTLTMVFRNDIDEFKELDLSGIFSGDVAIRAFLSTKGKAYSFPYFWAVYRQHSGGICSSKDFETNSLLWIKTRDIIEKKIDGIDIRDLNLSKFMILMELMIFYLKNKKYHKILYFTPKLVRAYFLSKEFHFPINKIFYKNN